jgi:hypothetical protein
VLFPDSAYDLHSIRNRNIPFQVIIAPCLCRCLHSIVSVVMTGVRINQSMMINETAKTKDCRQQFDLLSPQVKGPLHVRTGLVMQLFTEQIIGSAPSHTGRKRHPDQSIMK